MRDYLNWLVFDQVCKKLSLIIFIDMWKYSLNEGISILYIGPNLGPRRHKKEARAWTLNVLYLSTAYALWPAASYACKDVPAMVSHTLGNYEAQ